LVGLALQQILLSPRYMNPLLAAFKRIFWFFSNHLIKSHLHILFVLSLIHLQVPSKPMSVIDLPLSAWKPLKVVVVLRVLEAASLWEETWVVANDGSLCWIVYYVGSEPSFRSSNSSYSSLWTCMEKYW
jgi:hypothetical protein